MLYSILIKYNFEHRFIQRRNQQYIVIIIVIAIAIVIVTVVVMEH